MVCHHDVMTNPEPLEIACSYASSTWRVVPPPEYIDDVVEESMLRKPHDVDDADPPPKEGAAKGKRGLNGTRRSTLETIQLRRKERLVQHLIKSSGKNISVIVEAMRNNLESSRIQKKGCRALCELSYQNISNQELIFQAGGIEAILSGMEQYSLKLPVQIWACKALINLAVKNTTNQAVVCDRNGIAIILQGLQQHFTNADFQVMAFMVLGNLCTDHQKNREAIREAEIVLFFLIAGMKYHSTCSDLQKVGCGFLANFSYQENVNTDLIIEAAGIETIVIAMRCHPSEPEVCRYACAALTNICRTDEGLLLLKSYEGVGALLHCLQMYPGYCGEFAAPLLKKLDSEETS